MNKYSLENYSRPKLQMPFGRKKLLLHSCCAPCAGEIMEAVAASDIDTSIFFIIQIYILKRNMKLGRMRIFALLKSLVLISLMLITIKIIGLIESKVLRMNQNEERDALFVLICVLKEQHYMHMKISMM